MKRDSLGVGTIKGSLGLSELLFYSSLGIRNQLRITARTVNLSACHDPRGRKQEVKTKPKGGERKKTLKGASSSGDKDTTTDGAKGGKNYKKEGAPERRSAKQTHEKHLTVGKGGTRAGAGAEGFMGFMGEGAGGESTHGSLGVRLRLCGLSVRLGDFMFQRVNLVRKHERFGTFFFALVGLGKG